MFGGAGAGNVFGNGWFGAYASQSATANATQAAGNSTAAAAAATVGVQIDNATVNAQQFVGGQEQKIIPSAAAFGSSAALACAVTAIVSVAASAFVLA